MALALGMTALAPHATAAEAASPVFVPKVDDAKILLMKPDVAIRFITTGGTELRADWSETAENNLIASLEVGLKSSSDTLLRAETPNGDSDALNQATLLQQAVADAQAAHVNFTDPMTFRGPLPHWRTRKETYSVGPEAAKLMAGSTGADYAMFLRSRAQIESGGVFLTQVLIGVATGYTPPSQNFRGTAISLVDLKSGDIVWQNLRLGGDPRNPAEASSIMSTILNKGPLTRVVGVTSASLAPAAAPAPAPATPAAAEPAAPAVAPETTPPAAPDVKPAPGQ